MNARCRLSEAVCNLGSWVMGFTGGRTDLGLPRLSLRIGPHSHAESVD